MKKLIYFLTILWRTNPKTIYFNFKYLPWKQAIQFPVWISSKTYLRKTQGKVELKGTLSTGMIRIGYGNIGIFDTKRSRSVWNVEGLVTFAGKADIGHGSKIAVGKDAELFLGNNFMISAESTILVYRKISFGDDCLLSWDVLLMDSDYHNIRNEQNEILNKPAPIEVGNNVWFGCRCLVLKGSYIPDGSVIAANSLVNRKLTGSRKVFGGNPLSTLKENITWTKD